MKHDILIKEQRLIEALTKVPSCIIAFSGGLDSTYLCAMAKEHVPGRVLCVTIVDTSLPKADLQFASDVAANYSLEHLIIESDIDEHVRSNPKDRCYHCKSLLFNRLGNIQKNEGISAIMDGENASDSDDNRPGTRAAREYGVLSPLAAAGLTKADIRELSKEREIDGWDRAQSACLSSRIPTGTPIRDEDLLKVDLTEALIRSRGIRMIRARVEGTGARLELGQDENSAANRKLITSMEQEIKGFGWSEIRVDPSGYMPAGLRRAKNDQ